MLPAILELLATAGKQAAAAAIPELENMVKQAINVPLLGETLVEGELLKPGFVGPFEAVLGKADTIFLNAEVRSLAVRSLTAMIGLFAAAKAAKIAQVVPVNPTPAKAE